MSSDMSVDSMNMSHSSGSHQNDEYGTVLRFDQHQQAQFNQHFGYSNGDMRFLVCCMACNKALRGKDVYIYKGESSFCSEECRRILIEADEKKELIKKAKQKALESRLMKKSKSKTNLR